MVISLLPAVKQRFGSTFWGIEPKDISGSKMPANWFWSLLVKLNLAVNFVLLDEDKKLCRIVL